MTKFQKSIDKIQINNNYQLDQIIKQKTNILRFWKF